MAPRPERLLLPALLLVMGILMLNEGNEIAARESMIARDPRVVQARVTEVDVRERNGRGEAPDTYTLHVNYAFEATTPSGHTTPISGTTWLKTKNRFAIQPGDLVAVDYSGVQFAVNRPARWAETAGAALIILRVMGGTVLAAFCVVVALMLRA